MPLALQGASAAREHRLLDLGDALVPFDLIAVGAYLLYWGDALSLPGEA
jgi:hypothetical protein